MHRIGFEFSRTRAHIRIRLFIYCLNLSNIHIYERAHPRAHVSKIYTCIYANDVFFSSNAFCYSKWVYSSGKVSELCWHIFSMNLSEFCDICTIFVPCITHLVYLSEICFFAASNSHLFEAILGTFEIICDIQSYLIDIQRLTGLCIIYAMPYLHFAKI